MKNLLKFPSLSKLNGGILLMFLGLLLLSGGQVGFQIAENAPHWIPIPKLEKTWIAWLMVWLGFDSIFDFKITDYILSKTLLPILKPLLEPLTKHPRIQRIVKKLEENNGKR